MLRQLLKDRPPTHVKARIMQTAAIILGLVLGGIACALAALWLGFRGVIGALLARRREGKER